MAESYDDISLFQIEEGDYVRIMDCDVIITVKEDFGEVIRLVGIRQDDSDEHFEGEFHYSLIVQLITE